MKRLWILITLLALVLALPLSVSADIIYEPDDDFFEQHSWECEYVDRSYTTNGPDGSLTVYTSPENCLIQTTLPNRKSIYISHVYTDRDGIEWGCVSVWDEDITGWVPMSYVVPIYNGSDFWDEFRDRLEEEKGIVSVSPGQEIHFWKYPGSESSSTLPIEKPEWAPDYRLIFVDDAGRKWAKIGYYCGIHSSWVCLDDPSADYATLYADAPPQQVSKPDIQPETEPTTQPDTQPTTQPVSSDKIITPKGISPTTIVIAAVAVAAVSVGLLVVLKKKKS